MVKPKVVDHFEWHETGEKWQIRFDASDEGEFILNLSPHDHISKAKTLEKVKADAKKWLEENSKVEFKPVIVAWDNEPTRVSMVDYSETHLEFSYERWFKGVRKDGEVIWKRANTCGKIPEGSQMTWDDCVEIQPENSTSSGPFYHENSVSLEYTPERWRSLRKLSRMVRFLNVRLTEIVKAGAPSVDKMIDFLAKAPMQLGLPAPEPKVYRKGVLR